MKVADIIAKGTSLPPPVDTFDPVEYAQAEHERTLMSIRAMTPQQRILQFQETACWIDQKLYHMAKQARKACRLSQKIKDPALQTHSKIGQARQDYKALVAEIAAEAADITELEVKADQYWQCMSKKERGGYGMDFHVKDEYTPRLLGQTWRYKAQHYNWPPYFVVPVYKIEKLPLVAPFYDWLHGFPLGEQFEW